MDIHIDSGSVAAAVMVLGFLGGVMLWVGRALIGQRTAPIERGVAELNAKFDAVLNEIRPEGQKPVPERLSILEERSDRHERAIEYLRGKPA